MMRGPPPPPSLKNVNFLIYWPILIKFPFFGGGGGGFAGPSTFIQMKTLKSSTNTKSLTIFILYFYLLYSLKGSR